MTATRTVHFVTTGHTALGKMFQVGEELTVTDSVYQRTQDRNGDSWLDLEEDEQIARWGKVVFREGKWDGNVPYGNEAKRERAMPPKPVSKDGEMSGPNKDVRRSVLRDLETGTSSEPTQEDEGDPVERLRQEGIPTDYNEMRVLANQLGIAFDSKHPKKAEVKAKLEELTKEPDTEE